MSILKNTMPDSYSFSGDVTTYLGFLGVASTIIIVVTAFRRFFNSPYNLRMKIQDENSNLPSQNTTEN